MAAQKANPVQAVPPTPFQRSSVEWIIEETGGPSDALASPTFLPLANFDNVKFSNASATFNGQSGPINDPAWQNQPFSFSSVSAGGAKGADTSALTTNGKGFTVTCEP